MVNFYDELEIEDFSWDPKTRMFHYPCPCGDRFEISKAQLRNGEDIATCPSCSLIVRVIYDYMDWEDYVTSDEEEDDASSESSVEAEDAENKPADDRDASADPNGTADLPALDQLRIGDENDKVDEETASLPSKRPITQ